MYKRQLLEAGFKRGQLGAYIFAGLPGGNWEGVEHSVEFAHRLGLRVWIAEFSPIPGTHCAEAVGVDEDTDPLVHNNTAFAYISGYSEDLERVKSLAHRLNAVLRGR